MKNQIAEAGQTELVEKNVAESGQKDPKRASISLTGGSGDKSERLTLLAQRTASGGRVTVTTTDLKSKKNSRGMTQVFPSFEAAVAALGKLEKEAVLRGWRKSERSGGFKAKKDAFSAMPAAPKGK